MGNKAGKPARDDTARASSSASALAAEDAHAAGAAADAAAASSSEPPTHEPVPGLRVVLDVLSEAQHDRVVSWLLKTLEQGRAGALRGDTYAPIPDKWQKRNQSREMLQFGTYTHSNRVESFRDVAPMPPELETVVTCLRRAGVYDDEEHENALPTSCTVNFYEKGQWIPPHIDNPAFDRPVVTVSLRSTQRMTLGRGIREETETRDEEKNKNLVTVTLPKRSAVVLRGAAADEYEHAIPPVTEPRVSLTFRALGDENAPATKKRVARADAIRAQYRAERCKMREEAVRTGFGLVGPKGAVGRVGPLPEEVAAAEARRRAREDAVAAKREKKYSRAPAPFFSDAGGVCRASDAASPPSVSKSRAKKEARKAAKAVAKRERREKKADARVPGASRALAHDALEEENEGREGKRETLRAETKKSPKSFARSADGVTCVERRGKTRSCPPCPPELLESSSTVSANGGGDAKNDDAKTGDASRSERISTKVIPRVELENVQRVYDAVAKQWHGTRYRAWSGVEDFVNRMNLRGALVADVGCGNGKNAPAVVRFGQTRGGAEVIGCDFSIPLLEICATERGDERVEAFAADAASLPMRSSCFDAALNIAVLHHASTSSRRRALVSETMRVLRVGGVALFYAWALEQETGGVSGHRFESQDVLVPFHKRAETVGKKKKAPPFVSAEDGDEDANARREGEDKTVGEGAARVFQRYCHVYKEGELEALFDHLREWCRVDRVYYDCGNWCAEVTRTK